MISHNGKEYFLKRMCVYVYVSVAFPGGIVVKNLPVNAGDMRDAGSIPGSGSSPGGRAWQPIPVFLPGESHGQRSLAGCSPLSCTELDMTDLT